MKVHKIWAASASVLLAVGIGIAGASPASAAVSDGLPAVGQTINVSAPMYVGGFDAKRAKAEGFEVITGADGVTRSIPVTAAAKAATGGKSIAKASPNGTVKDTCGISSLSITRTSTANIREVTSYRVNFPSVAQHWGVDAISRTGGYFHDFSGLNASTTWTGEAVVYVSNSTGVTAHVSFGSFAEIIGGAICYSGNPTSNT